MTIKHGNARLLVLLVLLLFTADLSFCMAEEIGSIILKTGFSYRNVNYDIDYMDKNIKVNLDDKAVYLRFDEIDSLLTAGGEDITDKLYDKDITELQEETWISDKQSNSGENEIPVADGGEKEEWVSEYSPSFKLSREKAWQSILRFSGNYSIPIGDYYEGINSGVGFEGDIRFAIDHVMAIRLMLSRTGLNNGLDLRLYSEDPNVILLKQDLIFTATKYIVAFEYYNHVNKVTKDNNLFSLYCGIGAVRHKTTLKLTLSDVTDNSIWKVKESSSQSKFIMSSGGGLIKQITKSIGLDLSFSLDLVFAGTGTNSRGDEGPVYAYILELKAGLCYFIK